MEKFSLDEYLINLYSKNFSFEEGFERCIGIDVDSLRALKLTMSEDLDKKGKGIKWWKKEKIDKATNIILGDYLFSLPLTIEGNLVNAYLYKLEVELKTQKRNFQFRDSIQLTNNGSQQKTPRHFEFYLNQSQLNRQASGFFTSIGSILDCLAALIVGVCGLEQKLITASFPALIRDFEQGRIKCSFSSHQFFAQLQQILNRKKLEWAQWVTDLRNTNVHRSKRLNYEMLHPEPMFPAILNKDALPIIKTKATRHLPKAPHLTEVEAMGIYKGKPIHLNEDQTVTIEGVWQDANKFVKDVCVLLDKIWKYRKENIDHQHQPPFQWDNGKHIQERDKKGDWFEGYTPPDAKWIDSATVPPELFHRMEAAGLSDKDDPIWSEFRKKHLKI